MSKTRGVRLLVAAAAVLVPPVLGCTGFTFTPEPEGSSTFVAVEGLAQVGDAAQFEIPLTEATRPHPIFISAGRTCGEGVLEVILDGVEGTEAESGATFASVRAPGGATITGTIVVVRSDRGGESCVETSVTGQVTRREPRASLSARAQTPGCGEARVTGQGI
jgi:hypothetical protein